MVLPVHIYATSWSPKFGEFVHLRHGTLYNPTKGNRKPHGELTINAEVLEVLRKVFFQEGTHYKEYNG